MTTEKRARILIAEDEAIAALYLRRVIEGMGHDVVAVVGKGRAAVDAASEHAVDMLLFDIRLADDMDGIDAARQINHGIPVIFHTAFSDDETMARVHELNPVAVLQKPIAIPRLHDAVARALSTKTA